MENLPLLNYKFETSKLEPHKIIYKKLYVLGIFLFIFLFYFFLFSAPSNFPINTIINIKEGSSLRYTSKLLKDNDLIRSRVIFETFVIIFEGEKYLPSGDFLFENKIPVFEVARRLSKGERHLAPVKVTIPEGYNVVEISDLFSIKLNNFNSTKFLQEANSKEGYLFPDTYFFLSTDTEKEVLYSMSTNFDKKILPLQSAILSSNRSENEIITMASIIEKESNGDDDRNIISGILWKRLDKGMLLQVDVDPDTYKTKGLPKNPIANPGLEAIEAAIYPQKSDYLYYLHDPDGNIHYAITFDEHLYNKKMYLK